MVITGIESSLEMLYPDSDVIIEGFPTKRAIFEQHISEAMAANATMTTWHMITNEEIEIAPLTEDRAAVLRMMMEHVTHERFAKPHIMELIMEEVEPFLAGDRSVEDTARIIQNRVQTYLNERA